MSAAAIQIETRDGAFGGYLARPGLTGTGPGVLVLQEIFGVNTNMRSLCDDLARQGFVALAPDLFWRIEPGIMLDDRQDEDLQRAFGLFSEFNVDQGMEDIAAALSALREHPACTGKAGAVGYCLGGLLAYLSASRTDVDASVGYYGVSIHERLGEASRIEAPLMLHIAGRDEFVPPKAQAVISEGLRNHPQVTLHHYPERDHAFARVDGGHYHAEDAATANDRTLTFFRRYLA